MILLHFASSHLTYFDPQSRIVFFLMNIHNRFRTIYFARVKSTYLQPNVILSMFV